MMILEKLRQNSDRVAQVGQIALAQAKAAGVAAYYSDPIAQGGIVKEMPNGRRFSVTLAGDGERVTAELPPRE